MERISEWLEKIGEPDEINHLLRETKSYIAGKGIYSLMTEGDLSHKIEIFATPSAAKILYPFMADQLEELDPTKDEPKVARKNGIGVRLRGHDLVIHVTKNPLQSVKNLVINHFGVYYDGVTINNAVLQELVALNDLYIEDYLASNTFVHKNIKYFIDRGHSVLLSIGQDHIGIKTISSSKEYPYGSTRREVQAYITYQLYLQTIKLADEFFIIIDTCLLDYTFDELVKNLEKAKKYFLPEVYQGDVKKWLFYCLTILYDRKIPKMKEKGIDTSRLEKEVVTYMTKNFETSDGQLENIEPRENSKIYQNQLQINRLRVLSDLKEKYDILSRIREKTRVVTNLEFFAKPSSTPIPEVDYDEKKEKMCIDMESLSFYDINAYLKGEAVMAYEEDEKGNKQEVEDYALEPVSAEIASKRLVFFVASDEQLKVVKPYCYNLDMLEKDLATRLYSDTCSDNGSMRNIDKGFSDPLFKLSFETNVFVRLRKLLKALYSTKNQAFLLIPTREIVPRTSSLSSYQYRAAVSGDHCQSGTEKRVYRIVICGKGSDKCYPLNDSIQFRPDAEVESRRNDRDYFKFLYRYKEEKQAIELEQENAMIADLESEGIDLVEGDEE